MPTNKRTKTIRANAVKAAEQMEVPAKQLEEFMAKKIEIDTKLNDQLDDLLDDFMANISVFIGGHLKLDPRKLNEALNEHTAAMKQILTDTTLLFASIGDSHYKVATYEALVKGLDIVKTISIEMNDLRDKMDGVKKQ